MYQIVASLWLTVSLLFYWRSWKSIRGTTLESAWRWGWSGLVLWAVAWGCELLLAKVPSGLLDQMWYAVALMLQAGLVSVLGAKRPVSRVYTWFVTVPMLLVLGWPALYAWSKGWPPVPLRLVTPALLACGVVAIMGLGNYIGTRFLISAICLGGALACLILPYSGWSADLVPSASACRFRATLLAGLAILWPAVIAPTRQRITPWDRVWCDFINSFGIVWGRRLQDRFNDTASKSHWGVKLDFYGLTWDETTIDRREPPQWTAEMTTALEWLLRRFVDQEWINERSHHAPRNEQRENVASSPREPH